MAERLKDYRTKRDFAHTPEPASASRGPGAGSAARPARFVIQEHSARRLHWDLRLEHDGALASWALPRGMPEDPARNHKAVRTEDHPLEYLDFQGEIPRGNYGAGTMRIWDRGVYETEKWRADEVIVTLHGERARGRYSLFRAGPERDWLIHRMDPPEDPRREPIPAEIVPMLARPGRLPDDELRWVYEIKWDGVRAIAYVTPGEIRLESRNLRDITATYPELRPLARQLGSRAAVLDGEIVAFDADGRPSFSRLQERMHVASDAAARRRAQRTPVVYMIFDLLYLEGHSLMTLPYRDRRERLEALTLADASWQTPAVHRGDGASLLEATVHQGLEGLVAKRLDAPYEPGRRTGAWVKVKNTRRQEMVIGGWVSGEGRRAKRIGALLLGYYDADGRLVYAGRVGSGFSERTLDDLARRLSSLQRPASPFAAGQLPREAHFTDPALVAEVEFTEWTPDGQLRHPTFKGLRDDRDAREVGREDPIVLEQPPASEAPGRETRKRARRDAQAPTRTGAARGRSGPVATRPPRASRGTAVDAPAHLPQGRGPETLFENVQRVRGGYEVVFEGRELRLSNYDKVLFPTTGFTKGDLIEYYARIAPVILPHLRDRPLTLKRYPNGVEGDFFYEKNCPAHRPEWVQTARVASGRREAAIEYCLVQDAPTLVWAANLASIELHTSLSRGDPKTPTVMVFDLDPGPPAGLRECCAVGLILRGLFDSLGLVSVAKTSGSKGLQVYVPLNREASYPQTKGFSRQVAELLAGQAPDLVVARMTKSVRDGRVLVDWSQNDEHKTTVNVYSVRAQSQPTVSAPVSWEEVQRVHERGDPDELRLTTDQVLERVAAHGDLFAPALSTVQAIPTL